MTRKEASFILMLAKNRVCDDELNEALDTGIKALDILDKIRAEIESMDFDFGDYYNHTDEIIEKVCKVIDKYKTSEDK